MSEPLTSHEIEDVLSSIRRLVSEDLRPAARSAAVSAAVSAPAAPKAAEAGKLLLTPALRIVPEAAVPPEPVLTPRADSSGLGTAESSAPLTDQPAVHTGMIPFAGFSSTRTVDETDRGFALEDEVYDDLVLDEGDNGLKALLDTVAPDADPGGEAEGDAGAAGSDDDEVIWSAPGDPETALTEDLVDDAPAPLREMHGHWTAQDVPGVDWVQQEPDWAETEPVPFQAHPRKAAVSEDPLARAWADRAEAQVRAELHGRAAPEPAPEPAPKPAESTVGSDGTQTAAGPGLFEGDDSEIDEEVLRDIVRDIIREELAGALGERITRNVRKLVRVEINRALTAREFE